MTACVSDAPAYGDELDAPRGGQLASQILDYARDPADAGIGSSDVDKIANTHLASPRRESSRRRRRCEGGAAHFMEAPKDLVGWQVHASDVVGTKLRADFARRTGKDPADNHRPLAAGHPLVICVASGKNAQCPTPARRCEMRDAGVVGDHERRRVDGREKAVPTQSCRRRSSTRSDGRPRTRLFGQRPLIARARDDDRSPCVRQMMSISIAIARFRAIAARRSLAKGDMTTGAIGACFITALRL